LRTLHISTIVLVVHLLSGCSFSYSIHTVYFVAGMDPLRCIDVTRIIEIWRFVGRLPGYRSRGPGFYSRRCRNWSFVWSSGRSRSQSFRARFSTLPDYLRTCGSGMGSPQPREDNWGARNPTILALGICCADHAKPLYQQKVVLISSTSGCCSVGTVRLLASGVFLWFNYHICATFYLKGDILETGICARLQMESTQLGSIDRANVCLSLSLFGSTWRRKQSSFINLF
jgi:hypothetical protein